MFQSRIFTTNVGFRPAEPCTVTVAATHQLLTQILIQLGFVVVSDKNYRIISGTALTDVTLSELERCSADNVAALENIIGMDRRVVMLDDRKTSQELQRIGRSWANHVLEVPIAWAVLALYILITVISGNFLVYTWIAGEPQGGLGYVCRVIDALIYIWLPEVVIFFLRVVQGRPLWVRIGTRTVVVADVPWVAQSVEAFASKTFARAYAVATAHFVSANPLDHFLHRYVHRITRGTLIACGRPDGRLEALTSADASICLAMSQASSIQSMNATAEIFTVGHNPDRLPLATHSVILPRHRPEYLCERMLHEHRRIRRMKTEKNWERIQSLQITSSSSDDPTPQNHSRILSSSSSRPLSMMTGTLTRVRRQRSPWRLLETTHAAVHSPSNSASALSIEYSSMLVSESDSVLTPRSADRHAIYTALARPNANVALSRARQLDRMFDDIDRDNDGYLDFPEVLKAYRSSDGRLPEDVLKHIYDAIAVVDDDPDTIEESPFASGNLHDALRQPHHHECSAVKKIDREQFFKLVTQSEFAILLHLSSAATTPIHPSVHDVEPSTEAFFGEEMRERCRLSIDDIHIAESQRLSMLLYESRIASLQRAVAFFVLFHAMAARVATFWKYATFGLFTYTIDRTQSIMRVTSTAAPVSGAEVRERMKAMSLQRQYQSIKDLFNRAMNRWAENKLVHSD